MNGFCLQLDLILLNLQNGDHPLADMEVGHRCRLDYGQCHYIYSPGVRDLSLTSLSRSRLELQRLSSILSLEFCITRKADLPRREGTLLFVPRTTQTLSTWSGTPRTGVHEHDGVGFCVHCERCTSRISELVVSIELTGKGQYR